MHRAYWKLNREQQIDWTCILNLILYNIKPNDGETHPCSPLFEATTCRRRVIFSDEKKTVNLICNRIRNNVLTYQHILMFAWASWCKQVGDSNPSGPKSKQGYIKQNAFQNRKPSTATPMFSLSPPRPILRR